MSNTTLSPHSHHSLSCVANHRPPLFYILLHPSMSLLLPLIVKKCVFLQGLWQYLWFWPLFAVSNKTHNAFTPALPWQMRQLIRDWQKSSKQMQVLLSVSVCAWCIYVWKYYTNPLYFTFCCVYCTMICVIIPYYTMMCASNMCFLCVLCVYCSLSLSLSVYVCVCMVSLEWMQRFAAGARYWDTKPQEFAHFGESCW